MWVEFSSVTEHAWSEESKSSNERLMVSRYGQHEEEEAAAAAAAAGCGDDSVAAAAAGISEGADIEKQE
jgi:hypothetical protein